MLIRSVQAKTFSWGDGDGPPAVPQPDEAAALDSRFKRVVDWREIDKFYFIDDDTTNFSVVKVRQLLEHPG